VSRYAERFAEHPVHERLITVANQLSGIPKDLRDEAEKQEPQDTLERLEQVPDYVRALLGTVDPALVTEGMLSNLDGPLQPIGTSLNPLVDARDFAQLPNPYAEDQRLQHHPRGCGKGAGPESPGANWRARFDTAAMRRSFGWRPRRTNNHWSASFQPTSSDRPFGAQVTPLT
jgi:hypothetical protein